MQLDLSPSLLFRDAAAQWLESRKFNGGSNTRARFIAPATLNGYEAYIRALDRFFGDMKLCDIHAGHLAEYQEQRATGKLAPPARCRRDGSAYSPHATTDVAPHKINQEIGTLQMVMKRARCWSEELTDLYEPLQTSESDIPQALSPAEQELWLETAASRTEWCVVYWYSLIAFSTTASNCEMRALKLGNVNMDSRVLTIQSLHAKNKYRIRTVPLCDEAKWAVEQLIIRARSLGATGPQDFLFPFRIGKDHWDPAKPMSNSGLKKRWDEVRAATGFGWFTPHDCRHTAITRFAEAGYGILEIMSIAGQVSRKMTQHYTHVSEQSKRLMITAVQRRAPRRSIPALRMPVGNASNSVRT
jgi:integrase